MYMFFIIVFSEVCLFKVECFFHKKVRLYVNNYVFSSTLYLIIDCVFFSLLFFSMQYLC